MSFTPVIESKIAIWFSIVLCSFAATFDFSLTFLTENVWLFLN